jgi:8-oxo-dGTP pyrophosphatase MutT (NUDIX family)
MLCDSPAQHIKNIKIEHINDLCLTLRMWMEEEDDNDLCFYGTDTEVMLNYLKDFYIYIEAAGGLVKNNRGDYLFIKRFGMWDLPKGKIEKGELPDEAAVREVEEETGIKNLSVKGLLNSSWHIYPWKEQTVLKKTYWYLMESDFKGGFTPQVKEDITGVEWLDPVTAREALRSSYRSLRESLREFVL